MRSAPHGGLNPPLYVVGGGSNRCECRAIAILMTLESLKDVTNAAHVGLVGGKGIGASMIAQQVPPRVHTRGLTRVVPRVGHLLGVLSAFGSASALRR